MSQPIDGQGPPRTKMRPEAPVPEAGQGASVNGAAWEKFGEPRGWAAKWDGFALSRLWDWGNGRDARPDGEAR